MRTRYLDIFELSRIAAELNSRDPAEASALLDLHRAHRALLRPALVVEKEEAYPTIAQKAAALTTALLRERPFAGSNDDIAWVAMRQFIHSNGHRWKNAPQPGDVAYVVQRLRDGSTDEHEVARWLTSRLEQAA